MNEVHSTHRVADDVTIDALIDAPTALRLAMTEIATTRAKWTPRVLAWLRIVERALDGDDGVGRPSPTGNTIEDMKEEINDLKETLGKRLDLLAGEINKANQWRITKEEEETETVKTLTTSSNLMISKRPKNPQRYEAMVEPLAKHVDIEFTKLLDNGDNSYQPEGPNLLIDGVIRIVADETVKYGVRVVNKLEATVLYVSLFYIDNSDPSITCLFTSKAGHDHDAVDPPSPPLQPNGILMIGYGSKGFIPFYYNASEGKEREIGSLKFVISTEQVDISMAQQISSIERYDCAQVQVPVRSKAALATVVFPIIQYSNRSGSVQSQPREQPSLLLPMIGTFSTGDVHSSGKPRHQTWKYFPFTPDYDTSATIPHLFLGLNSLDIDCRTNIRIVSDTIRVTTEGFRLCLASWADTILHSARVSWLEIPSNKAGYEYGRFATTDDHPWYEPQTNTSRRITFGCPFDQPPKVVVALHALDMQAGRNCRVVVKATNVERDGFTIHIDTWGNSVLYMAKADWFAYAADRRDIFEGTLTVRDPTGKKSGHVGRVDFGGKLSKVPNVFVGFTMLDISCEANLRVSAFVDSVTDTGMTWHIDTWWDTILYGAGISYVCV